jgi:hypothetical protein
MPRCYILKKQAIQQSNNNQHHTNLKGEHNANIENYGIDGGIINVKKMSSVSVIATTATAIPPQLHHNNILSFSKLPITSTFAESSKCGNSYAPDGEYYLYK